MEETRTFMTPKQRMIAALNQQETDRVPIAPLYLDLYLAEEVRKRALVHYRSLIGDHAEIILDPNQEYEIQAKAILEAWDTLGATPDWLCWMPLMPTREWLTDCVIRRGGNRLWRVHIPTGTVDELSRLENTPDEMRDNWESSIPTTSQDVDSMIPLRNPQEILNSGSLETIRKFVELVGEHTFVFGGLGSPFWSCYFDIGFQGLMTMPYQQTDLFKYMLERRRKDLSALCLAYKSIGVQGIFIEECMASADLVSEKFYDRFVFPYTHALLEDIHNLGLMDVFYFCGDVMPRLSRLVELKPRALAFEESKKGFQIDFPTIANQVRGEVSLFGNSDATQFKDWTKVEMENDMRRQYSSTDCGRGFVFSTGSPFPLDTPREKVSTFIALANKFFA